VLFQVISVVVLLFIIMLSSAVNLSLRDVSLGRLIKTLSRIGRETYVDSFRDSQERFLLASAVFRMASLLGLILTVEHLLKQHSSEIQTWHYPKVLVVSALLVSIFGVAVPQALAKYIGVRLLASGACLPLLRSATFITAPLIWVLELFEELVRRLAGASKADQHEEAGQIEQEVLDAVNEAEIQGAVDAGEREMIQSVMELDEDTVDHIMTPRTELVAVSKDATLSGLKEVIKKEGHSRIPVFDSNIDQILGMVYAKDLLHVQDNCSFDVTQHLREVPFVPESKSLRDLLREFQTGRTHAAIVLDEYGGTAGLVTIEDILEELVGEIVDEYEQPEPEPFVRLSDRVVEIDSKVHVDEVNEQLNLEIPEEEDYETIGGFVFSTLGRIPPSGEELMHENLKITILEAEDRRIIRLRLEVLPPQVQQ